MAGTGPGNPSLRAEEGAEEEEERQEQKFFWRDVPGTPLTPMDELVSPAAGQGPRRRWGGGLRSGGADAAAAQTTTGGRSALLPLANTLAKVRRMSPFVLHAAGLYHLDP